MRKNYLDMECQLYEVDSPCCDMRKFVVVNVDIALEHNADQIIPNQSWFVRCDLLLVGIYSPYNLNKLKPLHHRI